ncbi:hypothetical protein GFO_0686 [Christiangramia forsetii KT0803]|uniref:Uncharacterized protein n=1 Tax=Christiangramia forsetii (strain DSM 17595 / CGMCC 1.15422 / KT0803) TaxID=411154 RepID=A0LZ68_CHRFK|nr:hypothetical protein GFO_0686 [Christiangramia forsetii KT0803]
MEFVAEEIIFIVNDNELNRIEDGGRVVVFYS